jgi:hypothetical protein
MHFEITSSIKPGKQLTPAQKNSSLFTEAPRIGTKTIRRGQTIVLSKEEFQFHEVVIKRLVLAGAIDIKTVNDTVVVPAVPVVETVSEPVTVVEAVPVVETPTITIVSTPTVTNLESAPTPTEERKKGKRGNKS